MPPKRGRGSRPQHRVTKRAKASKPKLPPPNTQLDDATSPASSEPVYFWRETDPSTGYLSQWYPCAFHDDTDPSIIYSTAEHYMMYQKALLFSDPTTAAQILTDALHPRQVRALGRQVSGFSDAVWNAHSEAIVRRGNLLKFTRPVDERDGWWVVESRVMTGDEGDGEGEEKGKEKKGVSIRELLLRTGEREIVEASPMDRIWGIGFGAARAGSVRDKWGLNLLGKGLMDVRDELKKRAEGEGGKGGEEGEGKVSKPVVDENEVEGAEEKAQS